MTRTAARDAGLVGAVALGVRAAVVAWAASRFPAAEDGHYYDVLARRLADGQGYTWLWPDGVVTWAAHYPVGYPAMLAAAYRVMGASAGVAMSVNAVLGALAAVAAWRLVDAAGGARWRALAAGLLVAVHPALVAYTAAVMTEGVTAALVVIAASLLAGARARSGRAQLVGWAAAGAALGVATLVRPQSLALAPVLGVLACAPTARWTERARAAAVVLGVALACVAPWTGRNCVRMHRCAMVSVNGGWNLLIGTQTEHGGWAPVDVPAECKTVWDEAGKDTCFEGVARARIAAAPASWLARAPAKVGATLDYFGAAPWYLHASNAAAFDEGDKTRLATVETVFCRLALLAALGLVGTAAGAGRRARLVLAALGGIAAVTVHAWPAYLALAVMAFVRGPRGWARAPLGLSAGAAVIALTAAVHAVFFGAGRYGLVVAPFVLIMALSATPVED